MNVESAPAGRVLAYVLFMILLGWGPVARANFITIDDPGGAETILYGINNQGQIVGTAAFAGLLFNGGTFTQYRVSGLP